VSPDKTIRDAANEASQRLRKYDVEKATRKDVFDVLQAIDAAKPALEPQWQRYLDRLLRDKKRLGLHLPEAERQVIKQLQEDMSKLGLEFSKNLNEENTSFLFTKDELKGIPDDVLQGFPKEAAAEAGVAEKYKVSLKYPDYYPAMKYLQNPEVRRTLQTGFDSRCKDTNTAILEDLIQKRAEMAAILGFPTHSAYITAIRMASSPEKVAAFLKDLSDRLEPLVQQGTLRNKQKIKINK